MLIADDFARLLKTQEKVMPDIEVQKEAEGWVMDKSGLTAQRIATVYSFMKHKYSPSQSLNDMEVITGISYDVISAALRALEEHGYITISRSSKPFQYAVIK